MRFVLHGTIDPAALAALARHEHATHALAELADEIPADPAGLLALVAKKQWNLLTTDTGFIRAVYESKIAFPNTIVQILDDVPPAEHAGAIDRLFERYKRLAPRRLYTITNSRVKIRQLPGGHAP